MIKLLATSVFIYSIILSLVAYFAYDLRLSLSVLLGGLTMWANIRVLALFWTIIFAKKSIALAVFIIIFKYLILALILWSLTSIKWLSPSGFCVGLTSLLFGVLVVAVKNSITKKEN